MALIFNLADQRAGDAAPSIVQRILSTLPGSIPNPEEDLYVELLAATMFASETAHFLVWRALQGGRIAWAVTELIKQTYSVPTTH